MLIATVSYLIQFSFAEAQTCSDLFRSESLTEEIVEYLMNQPPLRLKAYRENELVIVAESSAFKIPNVLLVLNNSAKENLKYLNEMIANNDFDGWLKTVILLRGFISPYSRLSFTIPFVEPSVYHFGGNPKEIEDLLFQVGVLSPYESHFFQSRLPWVSQKSLSRHFRKHKDEFGIETDLEYWNMAQKFLTNVDALALIVRRDNETWIKFDPVYNIIAIVQNNQITSFFILNEQYRSKNEFTDYLGRLFLDRLQ